MTVAAGAEEPDNTDPHAKTAGGTAGGAHLTLSLNGVGKGFIGSLAGAQLSGIGAGYVPYQYQYDPSKTVIGPGTSPQPGILFPPAPSPEMKPIQPIIIKDYSPGLTEEQIKQIFDLVLKEQAKKKTEEDMEKLQTTYPSLEEPIIEPSPEASDRVYKIPYASGGPVSRPRITTAIGGLFYAFWLFASWAVKKPAEITAKTAKTLWKIPVSIYRGAKHTFYVALPFNLLALTIISYITMPTWVTAVAGRGGWKFTASTNWDAGHFVHIVLILITLVWTAIQCGMRAENGHWWWEKK